MQFLGCYQWKSPVEIEPHLVSKTTDCSGAGAIMFLSAGIEYMLK
jgi:hypothetical protein